MHGFFVRQHNVYNKALVVSTKDTNKCLDSHKVRRKAGDKFESIPLMLGRKEVKPIKTHDMKQIKKFAVALITGLAVAVFFLMMTSSQDNAPKIETHVIYVIPEATIIGKKPVHDSVYVVEETEPEVELEDWMFDIKYYEN